MTSLERAPVSSVLQYQFFSLQLYFYVHSKQSKAPAKTLIIQFHLHVSTNNHWLAGFSRYCTPHLLTNIISFTSINFAVLWNAWFSKIICKVHLEQCLFLLLYVFFLKIKTTSFASFFSMLQMASFFLLSKIRIAVIFAVFNDWSHKTAYSRKQNKHFSIILIFLNF